MKSILLYLALVGTPFLGLLGILHAGESLDVPISIGGSWAIEEATVAAMSRSCVPMAVSASPLSMMISQSGTHVQVRFSDARSTSMVGRLHAGTLTVRQVLPSARHARRVCGETSLVLLQVRRQRASGAPDLLAGAWRTPECVECPAVPFRAGRVTHQ